MNLLRSYRASGADWPFGDLLSAHGVAMEGYFWRFTDVARGRVLIALCGVQRASSGTWGLVGYAASGGFLRTAVLDRAEARVGGVGACAGRAVLGDTFAGDDRAVRVDLGPDARLDVRLHGLEPFPRRAFGGSSVFQTVPRLNQYWHPWCLGGQATGTAVVDGATWHLEGADVYAEKNWGADGFPDSWWWGQAQGFDDPGVCVVFAGGQVHAGPLRTEVTGLVVRLPGGGVVRLGNPGISPVRARHSDDEWLLDGRSRAWQVEVRGHAPIGEAHILPVPLVEERRGVPGDLEHLTGTMEVRVRRRGRLVWAGRSALAALEHGGLARAAAEERRRAHARRPE